MRGVRVRGGSVRGVSQCCECEWVCECKVRAGGCAVSVRGVSVKPRSITQGLKAIQNHDAFQEAGQN